MGITRPNPTHTLASPLIPLHHIPIMDTAHYIKFFVAFAFVMALMWGLSHILRHLNTRRLMPGQSQKRLKLLEIKQLDPRNSLMLLACDDTEFVVLLGSQGQTLLQTIQKPAKQS